jgi:hypothetical protein
MYLNDMAKADHLYVYRNLGTVTHHGIDCGDGTVIHYRDGESIVRSDRAFFSRGEQIYVRDYAICDPPEVVLKRAMSRLGERDYHVVFNNCEHFAVWCKTGKHQSEQVDRAIAASLVGGVVGGAVLGGAFAVPAVAAAAGAYGVHKLFEQAQETKDPQMAEQYLRQSLAQLALVRQDLQPQLDRILREAYHWDCTARLAIQRGREDLARAARQKKHPLKQRALALRDQLAEVDRLEQEILVRS